MTRELIIRPPAEAVAVALLKAHEGMPYVATQVPRTMPSSMVRVVRAGGVMANLVTDEPRLVLECWASSSIVAEELAGLVSGVLAKSPGETHAGVFVRYWQELSGPVSNPDPDTGTPRYQVTGHLGLKPVL